MDDLDDLLDRWHRLRERSAGVITRKRCGLVLWIIAGVAVIAGGSGPAFQLVGLLLIIGGPLLLLTFATRSRLRRSRRW